MVRLNISCYIWSSLNSVVWIMVKRLLHSLLEEYESFSSRLLWVPPSVSNGGSALMSWWFLKLQSLCILAMHLKSKSSFFQKWSFFLFSCEMDQIHPGAYIFQRPFWGGYFWTFLYLEGLIYGGKFVFQNRLG